MRYAFLLSNLAFCFSLIIRYFSFLISSLSFNSSSVKIFFCLPFFFFGFSSSVSSVSSLFACFFSRFFSSRSSFFLFFFSSLVSSSLLAPSASFGGFRLTIMIYLVDLKTCLIEGNTSSSSVQGRVLLSQLPPVSPSPFEQPGARSLMMITFSTVAL